jgi:hypothetical protein
LDRKGCPSFWLRGCTLLRRKSGYLSLKDRLCSLLLPSFFKWGRDFMRQEAVDYEHIVGKSLENH